ncbi:transient receptor potential cation channel protein painless-like [Aethina tumida]|uniref:transient receptor potential cation channel protein painless-like n=1 Tax=Aethina tumida TaxID=116153 RepID=UPI0021475FE5|nr:transient receptor potential cation channel protein painless-like [Aethina tumida]
MLKFLKPEKDPEGHHELETSVCRGADEALLDVDNDESIPETEILRRLDEIIYYSETERMVTLKCNDMKNFSELFNNIIENKSDFKYSSKRIMGHPVTSIVLTWNWHRDCMKLYFSYILLFLLNFALIMWYIFLNNELIGTYVKFSIIFITIIFVIIELVQIRCYGLSYLREIENYLQVGLLLFTILTLCYKTYNNKNELNIEAFPFGYNITLLFLVLFFTLGEIPVLSVSISLYKTVLWNFFTHMLIYSLLLLAFASAFYYQNLTGVVSANNSRNITSSIFMTYIMFFGEYNTDNIQFENLPYHYMIVFVLFLLCVPLVLSNLLIGLAISDMTKIKDNAQYLENIERASSIKTVWLIDQKTNFIFRYISKFLKIIRLKPLNQTKIPDKINIINISFPKWMFSINGQTVYLNSSIWKTLRKKSKDQSATEQSGSFSQTKTLNKKDEKKVRKMLKTYINDENKINIATNLISYICDMAQENEQ